MFFVGTIDLVAMGCKEGDTIRVNGVLYTIAKPPKAPRNNQGHAIEGTLVVSTEMPVTKSDAVVERIVPGSTVLIPAAERKNGKPIDNHIKTNFRSGNVEKWDVTALTECLTGHTRNLLDTVEIDMMGKSEIFAIRDWPMHLWKPSISKTTNPA